MAVTPPTQSQIAQASKIASDKSSTAAKKPDKERATQIPKKVEGSFHGRESKPKARRSESEEEEIEKEKKEGLDVVA